MLTFCWNGWRGRLVPQSLEALRAEARQAGEVEIAKESESEEEGRDKSSSSSEPGDLVRQVLHFTKRQQRCLQKFVDQAGSCTAGRDIQSSADQAQKMKLLTSPVITISKVLL